MIIKNKSFVNRYKILFIVTQSEFGGAQKFIFEVVTHLDPEKYKILVAAGSPAQVLRDKIWTGELFQKLKNTQVRPVQLKYMKRVPWPWEMILAIGEIYNLLKKERPDILFLCSTTAGLLGSLAIFICQKFARGRVSVIYRIGGWAFKDPRFWILNKFIFWAEKLTAPLKDIIIVNSEIDRELAIKYKICPLEKIIKIYNGIDVNKLKFLSKEEARQKLSKTSNLKPITYLVGCVANFYKTKGLLYLIEAAKILTKTYNLKPITYFIIGEGKERKKLESSIKKYDLERQVILLGKISDAYKYLKAFDLFVLPSLKEGFPWIILEAMAAEVPIVATNVGAMPEIIENEKEGILIDPKNPEILAEKIFWFFNHQKEAKNMALQVKEKLKKFSLQKMIQQTETLFQ